MISPRIDGTRGAGRTKVGELSAPTRVPPRREELAALHQIIDGAFDLYTTQLLVTSACSQGDFGTQNVELRRRIDRPTIKLRAEGSNFVPRGGRAVACSKFVNMWTSEIRR